MNDTLEPLAPPPSAVIKDDEDGTAIRIRQFHSCGAPVWIGWRWTNKCYGWREHFTLEKSEKSTRQCIHCFQPFSPGSCSVFEPGDFMREMIDELKIIHAQVPVSAAVNPDYLFKR